MMSNQVKLQLLLKKKGIGPSMSKHLTKEELTQLSQYLDHPKLEAITKATILTSIIMLEKTEDEKKWLTLEKINHFYQHLPQHRLTTDLKKIIGHQHLNPREADLAFADLLNPNTPNILKAIFLEGQRLKRETFEENASCLSIFWKQSQHHPVNIPTLIDIASSYDGMNRTPNLTPFLAALLAAIGYPVILHGIDSVAPKQGINPYKILKEAGKNPLKNTESVISELKNKEIGWGYIDQTHTFKSLANLKEVRRLMVKRPILATIEKVLQPIICSNQHCMVTGYTHHPYKKMLARVLNQHPDHQNTLIVRGSEGSSQIALDRRTPFVHINQKLETEGFITPSDFGLEMVNRIEPNLNITTKDTLKIGIQGLTGQDQQTKTHLIYQALAFINIFKLMPIDQANPLLETAINSGKAFTHWEKGML